MGLLSRFIGKGNDERANELATNSDGTALRKQSAVEQAIAERVDGGISLSACRKIPLSQVAALGGGFAQLKPALQSVITGGTVGNGSIVRVKFPAGIQGKLATLKDTGEYFGSILTSDGSLAQARLAPVGIDPTAVATMAMAAMLVEVNAKLDAIQETQLKILSFLELDKQAEQRANLSILTDILHNYKFNWDNEQYRQNQHMKVLDIKQNAEKNIIFYQEQIAAAIRKTPVICLDQAVKGSVTELGRLFAQYRMALYLFAFSSYLDVMLLGNFRKDYLDAVAGKVRDYQAHYAVEFEQCRDMARKLSADSVETKVVEGIGNASKALGKLIGSSSILSKGPVDEWLQEGGDRLLRGNDEKIGKAIALFAAQEGVGSEEFVQSIANVGEISNNTTDILFDGDAMYLASA